MKIFDYWAVCSLQVHDTHYHLKAWSSQSAEDAARKLLERKEAFLRFSRSSCSAEDIAELRRIYTRTSSDNTYDGGILEPVVNRIDAYTVITRNRYGAEILNTDHLCIIDIDCVRPTWSEFFKTLFSKITHEQRLIQRLNSLLAIRENNDLGFRLYRTAKGFRLMVSGENLEPAGARTQALFKKVSADKLYGLLCRKQNCFRARLTPKPGRLGMKHCKALTRFPFHYEKEAGALNAWLGIYAEKSKNFSVCRLIFQSGRKLHNSIVNLHDEYCGVNTDLPLA